MYKSVGVLRYEFGDQGGKFLFIPNDDHCVRRDPNLGGAFVREGTCDGIVKALQDKAVELTVKGDGYKEAALVAVAHRVEVEVTVVEKKGNLRLKGISVPST